MNMTDFGRLILMFALLLAAIGGLMWLVGKSGFRGMPGDISYQGEHVRFYFPIVSSIVLSILLTLGLWLWRWFSEHR